MKIPNDPAAELPFRTRLRLFSAALPEFALAAAFIDGILERTILLFVALLFADGFAGAAGDSIASS